MLAGDSHVLGVGRLKLSLYWLSCAVHPLVAREHSKLGWYSCVGLAHKKGLGWHKPQFNTCVNSRRCAVYSTVRWVLVSTTYAAIQ